MSEQRFWFEEVPEDQQYWFLAPSGTTPRQQREQAELEELGLSSQDMADLRNVESDERSVFGGTEEAHERRKEFAETRKRMEAVGYDVLSLEDAWWPTVHKWEHAEGREYVLAPILYTKRELAEKEQRSLEDHEPEDYLQLVEEYGEADTDDLLDNRLPYRAQWVDRNTLLDKLEDAAFLCVKVDGRMRLRRDFIEELRTLEQEDA